MRRVLVGMVVVLALLGAACGGGDGSSVQVEATPAVLAAAADRLEEAERHRYELFVTIRWEKPPEVFVFDSGEPMGKGARNGDRYRLTFDFGPLYRAALADMPPEEARKLRELLERDLTLEMAGNDEVAYLRAPFYAAVAASNPDAADYYGEIGKLRDTWGRIDLAQFTVERPAAEVPQVVGAAGPGAFLTVVRWAEDVRHLGRDTVRGAAVEGLGGEVDAVELPSVGLPDLGDWFAWGSPELAVWVDGDGLVRRISVRSTTEDFHEELGEELSEEIRQDLALEAEWTLDVFDYGGDVAVDLPADGEAVDVTEAFSEVFSRRG